MQLSVKVVSILEQSMTTISINWVEEQHQEHTHTVKPAMSKIKRHKSRILLRDIPK